MCGADRSIPRRSVVGRVTPKHWSILACLRWLYTVVVAADPVIAVMAEGLINNSRLIDVGGRAMTSLK